MPHPTPLRSPLPPPPAAAVGEAENFDADAAPASASSEALSSSLEHSETSRHALQLLTHAQAAAHGRHAPRLARLIDLLDHAGNAAHRKRAARLSRCLDHPFLALRPDGIPTISASWCRDRLCPTCAARKTRNTAERIHRAALAMNAPRFVTLTLKSETRPISDSIAALRDSWKRLRRSRTFRDHTRGGVAVIQITRNAETGNWHPHIHALVDGSFWAQRELSIAWNEASRGSPICDIRAVPDRARAAAYIARYIARGEGFDDWPEHAITAYAAATTGVRFVWTWGTMFKIKPEVKPPRDDATRSARTITFGQLDRLITEGNHDAQRLLHCLERLHPRIAAFSRHASRSPIQQRNPPAHTDAADIAVLARRLADDQDNACARRPEGNTRQHDSPPPDRTRDAPLLPQLAHSPTQYATHGHA